MFEHIALHFALREASKKKSVRTGSVLKNVQCENCYTNYVYMMQETLIIRRHSSQEDVDRQAEAAVQKKLAEGCEPVPCPACGWYQSQMIAHIRRVKRRRSSVPGLVLTPVGFLVFSASGLHFLDPKFDNPVEKMAVGFLALAALGAFLTGLGFSVVTYLRGALHNPNATDQESRICLGQSLALRKEEFEALARESYPGDAEGPNS
jgi:hypothetical protein